MVIRPCQYTTMNVKLIESKPNATGLSLVTGTKYTNVCSHSSQPQGNVAETSPRECDPM